MAVEVNGPSKAKNFSITYSRLSKRIMKDIQVRHRLAVSALHLTKHCINVICNAKKMKATLIVATTLTNNQKKRNQSISATIMSLRMNPTKKTDNKAVQQLAQNSSLNLQKHNYDYEYSVNFQVRSDNAIANAILIF